MTDTPEAVRLADQIHAGNGEWMQKAAALLRRIPGLEAEVQEQARLNGMGAERELALMAQVSRLEAERDQLRAELEKVPTQLGYASMMGCEIFAGIFDDAIRPINNAVVIEFESIDELNSFLRWHYSLTPPPNPTQCRSERTVMSQHDTLTQALQDAASSLETISRLAGKAAHPNGDETCMGTFPEAAILAILAKLQATQAEPTTPGLTKEQFGYALHCAQVVDAATSEIARLRSENAVLNERLDATQEPVQAGELPALPHDGWPARFRCDSCDGNGEIGELISMGHFQPPERQTCPDCGGRGWSDEGPAFNADHMRDYARAVLSARKPLTPLTPAQMEKGRDQIFSINNPFCPCDSKTFSKVAEWVERHHGIGLEVKP